MPVNVPNIDYLQSLESKEFPDLGPKLAEALRGIAAQVTTIEQQTNSNANGQPQSPPSINSVNVTGKNGHFNIAITDNNQVYRDVHYWAEHADNPNFVNPIVIHMGMSRNHNEFLGNVTRYWRAYSSYGASPPSSPVYHGTSAQPRPVRGGGSVGGPSFQASQGSGTGTPGQGISGPGPIPFRSSTGVPPTR